MDLPSGLNADTGLIHKAAIIADYTFTFGTNKIGFYLNDAKRYTGEIVYIPLPFPFYLDRGDTNLINRSLYDTFPAMKRDGKHKYDGGVVHIMAGSEGLTGAAIMAAKSAWKQGAGSVFLYAPKKLLPVYETMPPTSSKSGLAVNKTVLQRNSCRNNHQKIKNKKGVLLAGPGIGTNPETGRCLQSVLKNHPGPAILDADALAFWKQIKTIPAKQRNKWLLTPHIGEASGYLNGQLQRRSRTATMGQSFVRKQFLFNIAERKSGHILCFMLVSLHHRVRHIHFSRAGLVMYFREPLLRSTVFKNNIDYRGY
jgi:ADP-dependent NAD(P)H-hydrate dehydratase / NAD(P)H-hydrate epimerase